MRSDADSQIRSVLTGDQQQKFDALVKERDQRGGDRRHQGDQGQPRRTSNALLAALLGSAHEQMPHTSLPRVGRQMLRFLLL